MPDVYGFDGKGVERIVNTVRTVEGSLGQRRPVDFQVPNWQHVRVTSAAVQHGTDGSDSETALDVGTAYYSGQVVVWDARLRATVAIGDVWVVDANGATLSTGQIYTCRQSGDITLRVACAGQDSDSDSDSDSEMACNSDSDTDVETRHLFVHGEPGVSSGDGEEITIMTCARLEEV